MVLCDLLGVAEKKSSELTWNSVCKYPADSGSVQSMKESFHELRSTEGYCVGAVLCVQVGAENDLAMADVVGI